MPHPGHYFQQDFLPLAVKLGGEDADARRIAARLGERGHEARSDHIVRAGKDRNDLRRLLRGANGRFTCANDEIHFGPDDCRRVVRKLVDAQSKTVIVDHKILPIDETVRLHRVEKRGILRRLAWTQMQITEAINTTRLLRARSERPCGWSFCNPARAVLCVGRRGPPRFSAECRR
jgi:hypothetical protein